MVGIDRLLIANRGEIAVRIARACREEGVDVVAVVTTADHDAAHAVAADEVLEVLEVPSYTDGEALVAAAVTAGADAVHPGYGFLSEDSAFAERVQAAGLTWVGPPPESMRALGDKISARAIAEQAGVPVVPGSSDPAEAARIGYPLLVKAAAGGGGRGMRRVERPEDLDRAMADAHAEAEAAFGDGRVFLERALDGARHVEVQVLLDAHGGGVHLGERDCSLQRRHQKIVEESPAPGVDDDLRAALGAGALTIARRCRYTGAGTAEFLLRGDGSFAFLEMNARLQVEHPVSEAVTGIDIVRAQLRIADGEPLWITQADVHLRGHAIEARVYAEDPAVRFLPATGRIDLLDFPRRPGVRIDTALRQGDRVGLGFDPLLAKVIAHGEDRASSLGLLRAALSSMKLVGVATNIGFLLDVLAHPDVTAGGVDTGWVERAWRPNVPPLPDGVHAGVDLASPWTIYGENGSVEGVTVAGSHALYRGWHHTLATDDLGPVALPPPGGALVAPLPAVVTKIEVAPGDEVTAGQPVVTLEAMKVQIRVDAPAPGTVRAIHVEAGDLVRAGQTLVDVETA